MRNRCWVTELGGGYLGAFLKLTLWVSYPIAGSEKNTKFNKCVRNNIQLFWKQQRRLNVPMFWVTEVQTMETKCWGLRQWNACTLKAEPTISQTNGEVARSWEEKHVRHLSGPLLLPICLPRSALLNSHIGKHRQTWTGSTFSCLSNPTLSLVHELACCSPFPMVGCHARP